MQYRTVGHTNLRVSEIGFGCGNNAALMVGADYQYQLRAVRHALDLGINYFDTAFAYGRGRSEENLGRILNELGSHAIVSTKIRLEPEAATDIKSAAMLAADAALKRLRRDQIDLIQLHNRVFIHRATGKRFSLTPQDIIGNGGVLDGFKALRRQGKVRFFGFSGLGDPAALREVIDCGQFHSFQAYYNILNPSAGHAVASDFSALDYGRLIDFAAAKGMGAAAIRVLASGALSENPPPLESKGSKPMSPGSDYHLDLERAGKIKFLVRDDIKSLSQAAIRFALMKPEISTVLVGFSRVSHIDEAVVCSGAGGLPGEQMAHLRTLWDSDFGRLE